MDPIHSEGLIQRKHVIKNQQSDSLTTPLLQSPLQSPSSPAISTSQSSMPSKNYDQYDFDASNSKEPKLTLMEEVFLLGLKDREVISYCLKCIKTGGLLIFLNTKY